MNRQKNITPRIVGFLCNWCCYGGADLCGVSRFQYPPYLRVVRLMCSGRVDLKFILRAFSNGSDGVFVGGCHLNDCHYNPEGNYDALIMSKICIKLLEHIGINPERFRLEWVSAGEGIRFADIMNEFSRKIKQLGPLGTSEGIDKKELAFKLEAVGKMIPYIKLWERERLRIPVRSEEAYDNFFAGKDLDRLFDETIADKLAVSQIMLLLKDTPLSTNDISEKLRLNPSEISRHMINSSRHGMVKYDTASKCYQRVQ
ncbi:hydrogenase iron-sulfur subunit [Desulfobacula toluolica]|uniref:MvhD8: methyl-viologen-reducing hydrogenase, delta subunit n=1 Tax=Desulfobacula toluolica (strain DSM 7467 / Tol2) TaxID=651182 RepID=K0NAI8_DESTT|nr:hydrogenase iron-sulfur subunit [Desulfobacula toluolica]CCK81044.1 MvhD8: methyl-viologen-reducing hydrogenase, delta subunit [Desulfobacula toluolica Tol2]